MLKKYKMKRMKDGVKIPITKNGWTNRVEENLICQGSFLLVKIAKESEWGGKKGHTKVPISC